jgi:hypothetical protein
MRTIKTFCIAHKAVQFDLPENSTVVWLGNDTPQTRNASHIIVASKFAPDIHSMHPFLSGSAGSFIVERYLLNNPGFWTATDLVALIQYRKFISPIPLGRPSMNYQGMYMFNAVEANLIDLDAINGLLNGDFLVSEPIGVSGGVLAQYNQAHHIEDFLRYAAIAVALKVVNKEELMEFFYASFIIPGGIEFGVFPIPVFLESVQQLKRVCIEFLKLHSPVSTDMYQHRALAFCNERLGSYLLLKHMSALTDGGNFDQHRGIMHCLSEDDVYR